MKKSAIQFLKFAVIVFIWRVPSILAAQPLNCTINSLTHNYLKIAQQVYDTDPETIMANTLSTNYVSSYNIAENLYVSSEKYSYGIKLKVLPIKEEIEVSKGEEFYYNFTIILHCNNGAVVNMFTTIPLIDTNNHNPFFNKPKYTYNLISTYAEDFKRQQFLNPIIATDYDVTNSKLHFSIDDNQYFAIEYNGIVPGTLNKNHYAQLVPKVPGAGITKRIELGITVTDMGYPPRSNRSTVVINPPSPSTPVFLKPFYVGHYYKNHTFVMHENPQLQEGCTFYSTRVAVLNEENTNSIIFYTKIIGDEINIRKNSNGITFFYEVNYIAYELKAFYTDPVTGLFSSGSATFIVELHHDL